jgi:hypothetical protein
MATPNDSLVYDGQFDWRRGMDSSLAPQVSDPTSVRLGINVTFRKGRPQTRPGFQQIFLTDDPDYPGSLALYSTGRDENNVKTGNYFQGGFFYVNKTDPTKSCLIACSGGYVFRIRPVEGYVARLPVSEYTIIDAQNSFRWDSTRRVYFCQAERFLVIQNGLDNPLIFDGEVLHQVGVGSAGTIGNISSIPVGTFMVYGQGRLFVVNPAKDSFTAGDLVYGGSTDQLTIASSTAGANAVITTSSSHGYATGDVVTISGHSSTPNINGTWKTTVTGSTTFTIPTGVSSPGTGGFVIESNQGDDTDLLRFTETTYLNEGGSFQIPSQMGSIRGMVFQPISDTATGQGDLLVFGEKGASSFAVANPRNEWKNLSGFQRVTLDNIGLVADRTLVSINNDVFFRSIDGLRTYRHARAQLDGFNVTPISTEMDAVMDFDTEGLLGESSAVYFDNRLLFTVSPRENYANIDSEPIKLRPVSFQGIGVLDFNSMGTSAKKREAVFDGVWTGVDVLQMVTGITRRLPRCFIFSYDTESNSNLLWENYPWALFDFPLGASSRSIKAAIETRSFDFNSPFNLKKLERGDLWISELSGETMVNVYWRPDENPCWFNWVPPNTFYTCSEVETCLTGVAKTTAIAGSSTVAASGKTAEIATTWKISFTDPSEKYYVRLSDTRKTFRGFNTTTQTWSTTTGATLESALNTALVGANPDGTNVTCTVTRFNDDFTIVFSSAVEAPVAIPSPDTCGIYLPANVRDQYRSQIRLPTPSNDCVTATNTLARVGHTFQFRFEWEGQFALSKVMFVGTRLIEPVGGGCP